MRSINLDLKDNTSSSLKTADSELFSNLDEASQASLSGGKYISRKPKEIVVVGIN